MSNSRRITLALLLPAALLASGCGFHLRGPDGVPPAWQRLCLEAGGIPVQSLADIRQGLRERGVTLLQPCPAGAVRLRLWQADSRRRVLSVDSRGRALEYGLIEGLRFELRRGRQALVPEQRVEVRRAFLFDARQVLAKGNEETGLRRRMRGELVDVILRRLASQAGAGQ